MTPELAVEIVKSLLLQSLALATPILLTIMTVGLMISLFQAVTSIHEQTLSFVPKLLAAVGLGIALLPWMLRTAIEFTVQLFEKIPQMAH